MSINSIIAWFKDHNIYSIEFYKKGNRAFKRWLALFFTSFFSVILICSIVLLSIAHSFLGKIDRVEEIKTHEVVPQSAIDVYKGKDIINIMLYGIDSRDMSEVSRSDSIMLLTIDKKHTKIKMTSIARDTRVDIEGYGKDKVNHAFAFGWAKNDKLSEGAKLSLKTINNNFNLNVTDYVTANFWALADIIDFIGGVTVEVDEAELRDINKRYIPYMNEYGIECEEIKEPGKQVLTGGQAVAYCRVRYVDGAVQRDGRQREVLMAMFEKAKSLPATSYPKLISLILDECTTTLSNSEILSLGTWAVANINSLRFDNLSLPTPDIEKSETINGVWYFTYDLDKAAKKIETFILETEAE